MAPVVLIAFIAALGVLMTGLIVFLVIWFGSALKNERALRQAMLEYKAKACCEQN